MYLQSVIKFCNDYSCPRFFVLFFVAFRWCCWSFLLDLFLPSVRKDQLKTFILSSVLFEGFIKNFAGYQIHFSFSFFCLGLWFDRCRLSWEFWEVMTSSCWWVRVWAWCFRWTLWLNPSIWVCLISFWTYPQEKYLFDRIWFVFSKAFLWIDFSGRFSSFSSWTSWISGDPSGAL